MHKTWSEGNCGISQNKFLETIDSMMTKKGFLFLFIFLSLKLELVLLSNLH